MSDMPLSRQKKTALETAEQRARVKLEHRIDQILEGHRAWVKMDMHGLPEWQNPNHAKAALLTLITNAEREARLQSDANFDANPGKPRRTFTDGYG